MVKFSNTQRLRSVLAGWLLIATPLLADDSEGIVRISDAQLTLPASVQPVSNELVVRGQTPAACVAGDCVAGDCVNGAGSGYAHGHGLGGLGLFGHNYGTCPHCGRAVRWSAARNEYVCGCNRKHGLFGHHSEGPGYPLFGHYGIVYPVDPGYFDSRDGNVYAAPGYGGPVAVPLAPVVNHQYNYGWGVPSSRLTPISHPAPYAPSGQFSAAPVARY